MKHLSIIAALLLTCTLSFADSDSEPGKPGYPPAPVTEVLKGFLSDSQGMTFQVESNGCTDKNSFEIYILESHPAQLQVMRKRPDHCRAFLPHGTTIRYTYKELGLQMPHSFYLNNQIDPGLLPRR